MAILLTFDPSRRRPSPARASDGPAGPARVLIFTGVRREPLLPQSHTPRHHAPMFHDPLDPAPDKPGRRKRRRGKTG